MDPGTPTAAATAGLCRVAELTPHHRQGMAAQDYFHVFRLSCCASIDTERSMRFVVKAVFWFTVVLLVLPKHPEPGPEAPVATAPSTAMPSLSDGDLIATLSALCVEESDLCTRGAEALTTIDIDTEQGMRIALDLIRQARGDQFAQPAN